MSPDDRIRWIREEHAKVEELIEALRAQVAIVPKVRLAAWIAETRKRFDHFRAHLIRHMALEEADGYLSGVMERRPTLASEVDRLAHEHRELAEIMLSIHEQLARLSPDDPLVIRECGARIAALLGYVERHEGFENVLIVSAFSDDIGSKD
jgi:hypothetical protein